MATIVVFGVTYFFATVSMVLRYITSGIIVRKWELDVVLITLAWGTALGFFISVCFCMQYGWGQHAWDITLADAIQYSNPDLDETLHLDRPIPNQILAISADFSRKQAEAAVWSMVELNFGILCNNMMRLKPFLNRYLPRLLTVLGLSSKKTSKKGESSTRGDRNWRPGKPSNSYQLRSLEGGEPARGKYPQAHVDEYPIDDSDKAASRQTGSTESILRPQGREGMI
ncbi:hypothetical protein QQX98_010700 [Neonectria punicea]|uniref:Integral membrane protein n=1 Tax=Neonectria punicea TaxID=979145 RepID=A0ABR1GNR2_9HYPO